MSGTKSFAEAMRDSVQFKDLGRGAFCFKGEGLAEAKLDLTEVRMSA